MELISKGDFIYFTVDPRVVLQVPGVHTSFGFVAPAPLAFQQEHGWDMWEGSQATGTELLDGTHLRHKVSALVLS